MAVREMPYGNYNFLVEWGEQDPAEIAAGFMEVGLPEARIEVIEYRQGNYKDSASLKVPGRVHYDNLILKFHRLILRLFEEFLHALTTVQL